jgi:extracellular elastinolytic metalloproteinase
MNKTFSQLKISTLLILTFFLLFTTNSDAQNPSKEKLARTLISKQISGESDDISNIPEMVLTSETYSSKSGVTHLYFQQYHKGIPVNRSIIDIHIDSKDQLVVFNTRQVDVSKAPASIVPSISAEKAVEMAANHFGYKMSKKMLMTENKGGITREVKYQLEELSRESIPVKLMWQPMEDGSIYLTWDLSIYELSGQNWWSVRVDATTGKVLDQNNLVIHCDFGTPHMGCDGSHVGEEMTFTKSRFFPPNLLKKQTENISEQNTVTFDTQSKDVNSGTDMVMNSSMTMAGPMYNVFPFPFESPLHTMPLPFTRSIVMTNGDPIASPFGWHDTDGVNGAEFTITRGNNVYAYTDTDANNVPDANSSPDGTGALNFNFPLDLSMAPSTYRDAAVTNLFYANNVVHDFAYKYGFTEVDGNFQENNYGKGGVGGDYVQAEAQDGSGTNNANFATPADGSRPRMQMFVWNSVAVGAQVISPFTTTYDAGGAAFGPQTYNVTGELALANPILADVPITGTTGKIAVIDRGGVGFNIKVKNAQNNGAIAVIICDNAPGGPASLGGVDATINIPAIRLKQNDCITIKLAMTNGPVMFNMTGSPLTTDSDFDNGIIAHEYAHGISNRLTSGPASVGCLANAEQMGEGWSDYVGLMMTMLPGDSRTTPRGIGNYVIGRPIIGVGIRPTQYTTDMNVNPSTYASVANTAISRPHGIGYVWATMLWDMTWDLIDAHGRSAGFDIAMNLVMEGMKLQPCSPGFVDGRDAILAADRMLNAGANQCLIWTAFAKRGLGFSANQGSSLNRSDGVEAFDLPPNTPLLNSTSITVCSATALNVKLATNIPSTFSWITGTITGGVTGASSGSGSTINQTLINPGITVGTVQYVVTATPMGCGSPSNTAITVTVLPEPHVNQPLNQTVCTTSFASTIFSSNLSGTIFNWTNSNTNIGLPSSGTGNIPSYAPPVNSTLIPIIGNITVTTLNNFVSDMQTITGSLGTGDLTLTNFRINRFSPPSVCGTQKANPGVFLNPDINGNPTASPGPYFYDRYTYTNTAASSKCVTVTYTSPNANFVHVAAYLGTFNPLNVSQNYLGDGQGSANNGLVFSFSVDVPSGSTLILVAFNPTANASTAQYTMTVNGIGSMCMGTPKTFTYTINPTLPTLSCGWTADPNGVGCTHNVTYNHGNQTFEMASNNCQINFPYTSDAHAFAQTTLCGDGSITTLVNKASMSSNALAGLIMRETTMAGAKKAQLTINKAGMSSSSFRDVNNASATFLANAHINHFWLRITRTGNVFSTFVSLDGTTWKPVGTKTIAMASCINMGLIVHTSNVQMMIPPSTQGTASFSNTSTTGSGQVPARPNNMSSHFDQLAIADFKISPNPTYGLTDIDLSAYSKTQVQLDILSLQGKLLRTTVIEAGAEREQMDLSGFSSGMYLIRARAEGLPDVTKRLVVGTTP